MARRVGAPRRRQPSDGAAPTDLSLRSRAGRGVAAGFLVAGLVVSGGGSAASARPRAPARPTIVLIVTDDQRWDTLAAMPGVQASLVDHGVRFANGYVVNPMCCPSRASLLTGLYSHSTGVYTNRGAHGGFAAFDDRPTIATALNRVGYRTALFGRYLNGYEAPYVPPGWDRWFATYGNSGYYGYTASDDGIARRYGFRPADYGTTVLAGEATSFIEHAPRSEPLFVYFAPHAPHAPAIPAPGDGDTFRHLGHWRPKSYNERNMSDKPGFVSRIDRLSPRERRSIDRFRRRQYRSLLGVDRAVSDVIAALRATGRLSTAFIAYTSDNGVLWGEHRWTRKGIAYEEAVRVPFVVRYDPLTGGRATSDGHLVLNIDLASTLARLSGAQLATEGRSLLPLLAGARTSWRSHFLIEHLGGRSGRIPTFCAVHAEHYVLVRYDDGELELYRLSVDPLELENRARNRSERRLVGRALDLLRRLCRPPPPGYDVR
jgi:N-acetylglucosamine-6-sulfatase